MNKFLYKFHGIYFIDILLLLVIVFSVSVIAGCGGKNTTADQKANWEAEGLITTGQYRTVAIADMDGDGNMDVVGGSNLPGTVAVWYGDGQGGLTEYQFLPIKADVRSVATPDINNDGRLDLVFSVQREALGVQVWINQAGRKWLQAFGPDQVKEYENIQTADINWDGYEDIVAANSTEKREAGIQIWLGDKESRWLVETGPTNENIYTDVALDDFNKDGEIDIAGAGFQTDGAIRVWLGDGTGSWTSMPTVKMGSFYALSTGDINGDGNPDILAGTYRMGINIFLGDGKGNFKEAASPVVKGSFWKVLPLDLNGDGRLDIVAGSIEDKGIKAWSNKGGSWAPITGRYPTKGFYYDLTVGDLNGDGRNDLCAANFGEGIKVWMGKGGSPAAPPAQVIRQIPSTEVSMGPQFVKENDVFTTVDGNPQYKIGPGDVLELTTWRGTRGNKEEITVRSDGNISFAFVQDLYVTGLTVPKLDALLRKEMKAYIKKPRIDVTVKRYNSKFVTLTGSIQTISFSGRQSGPGQYALKGKVSLLEMINIAGGPTNDANLNRVRVRRKNGRAVIVDLFKVIVQGDTSQDIILDDEDLVIVPSITTSENRVYIYGEVKNPGLYSFTGSRIRMFDLISRAGDVTVFAKRTQARVVRGDKARPEVLPVDLKALLERGDQAQNIALTNGDFVYVPRTFLGDAKRFLAQIQPLLDLITNPAVIRDTYGTSSSIRPLKNLP